MIYMYSLGKVEIKEIEADETNRVDCRPVSEVTHIPNYNGILKMFKTTVLKYPDALNMNMMLSSDNCNGLHCGCTSNQSGDSFKSANSNFKSFSRANEQSKTSEGCCQAQKAKNDEPLLLEEHKHVTECEKCPEKSAKEEEFDPLKKSCCYEETKNVEDPLEDKLPPAEKNCCESQKMTLEEEPSASLLKQEDCCGCSCSASRKSEIHKGCKNDATHEKYKLCLCSVTKELKHRHSLSCGHPQISHNGHLDYIVDGRLHYQHGDHCDDHGPIEANNRILFEETNFTALDTY